MLRQRFVNNVPSLHHEHDSYKWWVLANIMISGFMVVLDGTVVNTALPKIMSSFGISVDVAQWILTAYMLAFAEMLPRRPVGHEVGIGQQHAWRVLVRLEHADGLAGLDEQGFVAAQFF